ncbi:MAG TPA: EAL domain-containing protein [Acidobacteriaceae bacterium]|nr:EAL domain-containing protein [Acidobacteriaceae bacterium]
MPGAILRALAYVLLCACTGLAIGGAVASHATVARLDRYAHRLLRFAEAYNSEIGKTLVAVNASPFPFCSSEDITRLRHLVFEGHVVKEIGRVRGGKVYCTSTAGMLATPVAKPKPDIVTPSGISIWLNQPLLSTPGVHGDITESGSADFVSVQDVFGHLREEPMLYTTTLANRTTGQVLRSAGDPLVLTSSEVIAEKTLFRNGVLYMARCSERFAPCMVTGIRLRDAWHAESSVMNGFLGIGASAGLALGVTLIVRPRKRSLVTQLRRALRRNLITVVYQPIVDIKTGSIVGAEALARWIDEEGNYVRPDVFVAAAEELGFIGKLTRSVLRILVRELGDFLREHPGFHVSVNIAAADLADPQFLPMMEKLLRRHRIRPQSVGLELTERSTADHALAVSSISRLRALGHTFYIDDFGTGYSSLSYLNELAVDAIKIDRAFTDAVGTESLTAVIVPQILAMARTLDVTIVVEGVERAEQSAYFADLDQPILAQGWHFGEPVPAAELIQLYEIKQDEHQLV